MCFCTYECVHACSFDMNTNKLYLKAIFLKVLKHFTKAVGSRHVLLKMSPCDFLRAKQKHTRKANLRNKAL